MIVFRSTSPILCGCLETRHRDPDTVTTLLFLHLLSDLNPGATRRVRVLEQRQCGEGSLGRGSVSLQGTLGTASPVREGAKGKERE